MSISSCTPIFFPLEPWMLWSEHTVSNLGNLRPLGQFSIHFSTSCLAKTNLGTSTRMLFIPSLPSSRSLRSRLRAAHNPTRVLPVPQAMRTRPRLSPFRKWFWIFVTASTWCGHGVISVKHLRSSFTLSVVDISRWSNDPSDFTQMFLALSKSAQASESDSIGARIDCPIKRWYS